MIVLSLNAATFTQFLRHSEICSTNQCVVNNDDSHNNLMSLFGVQYYVGLLEIIIYSALVIFPRFILGKVSYLAMVLCSASVSGDVSGRPGIAAV